jgi:hypothetical protein
MLDALFQRFSFYRWCVFFIMTIETFAAVVHCVPLCQLSKMTSAGDDGFAAWSEKQAQRRDFFP